MTEFDVLRTAAEGMDAQRASLETAARNVAAAEVASGGSFTRLLPRFAVSEASETEDGSEDGSDDAPTIRFIGTQKQTAADVDAVTEMVAVLDAQRAYEANASIFADAKDLMERTIDLGRV